MEHLFSTALTFRQFLVTKLEKLDNEQLDTIPEGFNNNIRWNIAHLIVTPHLLTYNMVGQKNSLLSDDFINSAKKGSNPDSFSMNEDFGIKHLSETLIEVIKKLQRDYDELLNHDFKSYETSTGYVLKDIPSAIAYSNIHDGIHIGTINAIVKVLDT